ncbi:MAG TPA: patatin-like phospholipase family protein [Burkholderiales bacterium]|jgi:NTE family protein|nr:patatin-like phospholipase family protein [Burkholderiales bacterium]
MTAPIPDPELITKCWQDYDYVALLLQGGGALGSYQAGVYEALHEAGIAPNWLAGISIGAINGALIAGNPPEKRVERLWEFWEMISNPNGVPYLGEISLALGRMIDQLNLRALASMTSAAHSLFLGQMGFFTPRVPPPQFRPQGAPGADSFYDTEPLRHALNALVDFDLLNNGPMRISVGMVDVESGNFRFFDSGKAGDQRMGPEHIMASSALPPAFPPVKIGDRYYWDGGIISNTPLEYLLDQQPRRDTLAFQVDLWSARGELPKDIMSVLEREKEIRYSSRTRHGTDRFAGHEQIRQLLAKLLDRLPAELRSHPDVCALLPQACHKVINVIHLIYQSKAYELHSKDYEFSHITMREHWQAGYEDTRRSLAEPSFLERPAVGMGVVTHDIHRSSRK